MFLNQTMINYYCALFLSVYPVELTNPDSGEIITVPMPSIDIINILGDQELPSEEQMTRLNDARLLQLIEK